MVGPVSQLFVSFNCLIIVIIGLSQVNVNDANARTEKGVENLQQAAGYQKKYRKWLVFLLIITLCIAGGIAAYFVVEEQKNKK